MSDWAHRTGSSTDPMLRLGPAGLEVSPGRGPRERWVEVTELDSGSLALIATVALGLGEFLSLILWSLLLLVEVRIDVPLVSVADAWYQIPVGTLVVLGASYLAVRSLCWLYNRLAGRFGGFVIRLRE